MRYQQRHRPDLSERDAAFALVNICVHAVFDCMEDDNARSIWRVPDPRGDVLLVVDNTGCVRTVLPAGSVPANRRPVR
jgi:hypothetical protein